jgi:hypothetical protein
MLIMYIRFSFVKTSMTSAQQQVTPKAEISRFRCAPRLVSSTRADHGKLHKPRVLSVWTAPRRLLTGFFTAPRVPTTRGSPGLSRYLGFKLQASRSMLDDYSCRYPRHHFLAQCWYLLLYQAYNSAIVSVIAIHDIQTVYVWTSPLHLASLFSL